MIVSLTKNVGLLAARKCFDRQDLEHGRGILLTFPNTHFIEGMFKILSVYPSVDARCLYHRHRKEISRCSVRSIVSRCCVWHLLCSSALTFRWLCAALWPTTTQCFNKVCRLTRSLFPPVLEADLARLYNMAGACDVVERIHNVCSWEWRFWAWLLWRWGGRRELREQGRLCKVT